MKKYRNIQDFGQQITSDWLNSYNPHQRWRDELKALESYETAKMNKEGFFRVNQVSLESDEITYWNNIINDHEAGTTKPYYYYFASTGKEKQEERTLDEYVTARPEIFSPLIEASSEDYECQICNNLVSGDEIELKCPVCGSRDLKSLSEVYRI